MAGIIDTPVLIAQNSFNGHISACFRFVPLLPVSDLVSTSRDSHESSTRSGHGPQDTRSPSSPALVDSESMSLGSVDESSVREALVDPSLNPPIPSRYGRRDVPSASHPALVRSDATSLTSVNGQSVDRASEDSQATPPKTSRYRTEVTGPPCSPTLEDLESALPVFSKEQSACQASVDSPASPPAPTADVHDAFIASQLRNGLPIDCYIDRLERKRSSWKRHNSYAQQPLEILSDDKRNAQAEKEERQRGYQRKIYKDLTAEEQEKGKVTHMKWVAGLSEERLLALRAKIAANARKSYRVRKERAKAMALDWSGPARSEGSG